MKIIYKTTILFLLLLFSFGRNSKAQNESLRFEHMGTEEGLSSDNISVIFQDSKGYLWFGTSAGLNKYDGYTFTKYQFDPFDSNSLSQNSISTIFEDKYGAIWVGTSEGLCKFERFTEKFTRYKPLPNAKFSDPNISAINEDTEGMIWVGNHSGGLCRFNSKTGKFLPENFDLDFRQLPGDQAILHDDITCIYKDRVGTLWVGNNFGLHKINLIKTKAGQPSRISITHYQHDPENSNSLSSNTVGSVMEDKAGIIWVATNNGLNSFDRNTGIFKRFQHDPRNNHSISSNNLVFFEGKGIKEDEEGNLWISTNKGLNKLSRDRTVFTPYFHDPNNAYSLSTNFIFALEIDRTGVLWAGSWHGKLNKANLNRKAFGLRRNDQNNTNSLSSNEVTSIREDSSGIIWISTYGEGLNRWDKKINQFTRFRHEPGNPKTLKYDTVQAILEDRHGHLWICNEDVLSQLNKQTGEFTHYNSNAANYKEKHERFIYSVTEDHEGLLWLGTGNGIKSFDEKTGEFKHYYYNRADTNGISDYTARTVFADSRGNIWIGYGSVATDKFNKRTGRFTHYKHDQHDSTSISSNVVNSFFEDSKGNLWFGTLSGGLCYFNYQKEKFTTFTNKNGLPGNTIYSILSDDQNYLWLGTGNGLSRFDPVVKTFTNYDYKDGLQGNIFAAGGGGDLDRGACFKGKDGTLYFGGNNGFNFFNPLGLKADTHIAPVVITQFKLFDKLIKGANESQEIILDYDQNYFSFEFSSLSYFNPAKNQYAYKLEGIDKEWIFSGTRRYVGYTNINPGTYTFRVKGTNNDGIWNKRGRYIALIIHPPWWRTWWAYTLFVLLFAGIIYAFFRYRINKLSMQNEIVLQRHKALELEMENQQALLNERLRISRELHDDIGSTLGSISIYSEVAKKRTQKNEDTDEVLSKIGLVSRELIDKMSDIVWSLNPNHESFEQLQNRMMTFAGMILPPRNILYDFIADEELKKLQLTGEQRKNIFLIFKEALYNVLKYADCKSAGITLTLQKDDLIMIIQDDGKGFDVSQITANKIVSSGEYLGGNGIKNMNARANDMEAKLCISSKINEGTTVQLTLHL
jgi:ligand-binding sensor domain-containing protein/signal transduction histidine kinase